jgi:murein DD-endopeptidase MepM/ murein hydrolase activator NlpD
LAATLAAAAVVAGIAGAIGLAGFLSSPTPTATPTPPLTTTPPPPPGLADADAIGNTAVDHAAAATASEAVSTPILPRTNIPFAWPTPLPVTPATPWASIVQAAASGDPSTGLFGLHRNSGSKFHEGVDIRPAARDRKGEPTDTVRAALPGVVVHTAPNPNGPYGRYVVLGHTEPGLRYYTLYAHLRSVDAALKRGATVGVGTALGVMGRSDEARGFPKERAHLHFEIGLRLSPAFGEWYGRQREFKVPNRQSVWNGLNLCGLDPLPYLQDGLATGTAPPLLAHLRKEPTACPVVLSPNRGPADRREPTALLAAPLPAAVAGWKIEFAWHGLPLRWTPLAAPPIPQKGPRLYALRPAADPALARKATLRGMLGKRHKNGAHAPGPNLDRTIAILFER